MRVAKPASGREPGWAASHSATAGTTALVDGTRSDHNGVVAAFTITH